MIILFEAIYYIPDATRFVQECRRVLRPGGRVLVATANKDLWDFSPSPLSHSYYGAAELVALFAAAGFRAEVYGYMPVEQVSWRQRIHASSQATCRWDGNHAESPSRGNACSSDSSSVE